MKKNIAVFFGGKSCEHEISVITAHRVMGNLSPSKYEVIPVYIDGGGVWHTGARLKKLSGFAGGGIAGLTRVCLIPGGRTLYSVRGKKIKPLAFLDAAVLAMHGMNGEDGTLQGLLELSGVPYTSCGVAASAMFMDKATSKLIFKALGIKTLKYEWFFTEKYKTDAHSVLSRIEAAVGYPCIVKPANLGSSIGIGVARTREALIAAIEVAAAFDNKILVEKALTDFYEINCSAFGSRGEVRASECEMPVSWQEFLTFQEKYCGGGQKAGMQGLSRRLPADIPPELREKLRQTTLKVFEKTGCKGVLRIDYIIDKKSGTVYINEVNTIPGSLAFYLWEQDGILFPELLDRLIFYAESEERLKEEMCYAYDSDVLKRAGESLKAGNLGK